MFAAILEKVLMAIGYRLAKEYLSKLISWLTEMAKTKKEVKEYEEKREEAKDDKSKRIKADTDFFNS